MMHLMLRSRRLRKATSTIATLTLLMSMVVIAPASAATPTVPASLSAGTTNIASIDGTGSAGLLGTYSFEVAGTPATRGNVRSDALWAVAQRAAKLADINVSAEAGAVLRIRVEQPAGTEVTDTIVPGLSNQSTVQDVVDKVNASFGAWVTASFVEPAGKIQVNSNYIGDVVVGVYDEFDITNVPRALGMADCVFGGTTRLEGQDWEVDDGATPGTDYSAGYGVLSEFNSDSATFTPVGGLPYAVGAEIGSFVNGSGAFQSSEDTLTGFFTAIKFTSTGHEFTLKSSGRDAGIAPGFASFNAINGVRDPMWGSITVLQGADGPVPKADWQAGMVETITVSVPTTDLVGTDGRENAINGVKIELPAGFSFDTTPNVTVSEIASASIAGNMLTVDKFQVDVEGSVEIAFRAKNAIIANYNRTGAPSYKLNVSTSNVGGTAYTLAKTADLMVTSKNVVALTTASATEINAGGFSKITGKIFDEYGNEIIEWNHRWDGAITASPSPTGTLSPTTIATDTPASPVTFELKTSTTAGVNTVALRVDELTATANVAVVNVDTTAVGDPYRIMLLTRENRWNYSPTETPEFYLKVVDVNGKGTSFLNDRWFYVRNLYQDGDSWTQEPWVDAGYSESEDFGFDEGGSEQVWTLSSWDPRGWVLPSPIRTVTFSKLFAPNVPYRIKVTANPPIPSNQMSWDNWYNDSWYGYDKTSFGLAAADGADRVTFTGQVVDRDGVPVAQAGIAATMSVGWDQVGKLNANTAVTDANGRFTFYVTSATGSRGQWMWEPPTDGWAWSTFSPISVETTVSQASGEYDFGFAYFYAGVLDDLDADKWVALANGTDRVAVTATVVDQAFGNPVADWPVSFSSDGGSLSATSAVTNVDGEATVFLTSNRVGEVEVNAVDKFGNRMSIDVDFTDISAVVDVLETNVQGGEDATARVRLRFQNLTGAPVYFDEGMWSGWGWEWWWAAQDVYLADGSVSNDLQFVREETTSISGETVVRGLLWDVPAEDAYGDWSEAVGARTAKFTGFWLQRWNGIFYDRWDVAGTGEATVNFVNNATLAASFDKITRLSTVSGQGFTPAEPTYDREMSIYLYDDLDTTGRYIGPADVDPTGKIYRGHIHYWNVPPFLPAGTYDVTVDQLIFRNALTVTEFSPTSVSFMPLASPMKSDSKAPIVVSISSDVSDVEVWVDGTLVGMWDRWADYQGGLVFRVDWSAFSAGFYPGTAHTVKVVADGYTEETATQVISLYSGAKPTSINMPVVPSSAVAGRAFTTNVVFSEAAAVPTTIYAYQRVGGRWMLRKTMNVTTASTGGKSFRMSLPSAGLWAIRARYGGSMQYAASISSYKYVRVR